MNVILGTNGNGDQRIIGIEHDGTLAEPTDTTCKGVSLPRHVGGSSRKVQNLRFRVKALDERQRVLTSLRNVLMKMWKSGWPRCLISAGKPAALS